jgi:hypothetical protein
MGKRVIGFLHSEYISKHPKERKEDDFENAILDLFEKNRITIQDAKIVLWALLTAIYEDELIEEPQRRETIIENIERQKEQLLVNILGPR